jgi:hypothetical protein
MGKAGWRRCRSPLVVLALCAAGALAAACGSSGPSASGPSSTSSSAPGATSAPSATSAASSGSAPSCPPASAVGAAMGSSFNAPQVNSGSGGTLCGYTNPGGGNGVQVLMSPGITSADIAALAKDQGSVSKMESVSGVGSMAIFDVGTTGISSELFVLDGTYGIEVTAVGSESQMEGVAKAVIAT